MSTPQLFSDIDGVLADFLKGFREFFTEKYGEKGWLEINKEDWLLLKKEWPTFWADLEYEQYALDLWRVISPYRPSLLTAAPPSWPSAGVGKTIWAKRMLPKFGYHPSQQVHTVMRADKKNFAKQPDGTPNILIDDMAKNIQEWSAAGGLGIVYIPSMGAIRNVQRTIEQFMAQR